MHSSQDEEYARTEEEESSSSSASSEQDGNTSCKRRVVARATSGAECAKRRLRARSARKLPGSALIASTSCEATPPGGRRVLLLTRPCVKRRSSGACVQAMTRFKMPVPNYQRPASGHAMTLGARKPYAHLTALLASITCHITNPGGQGPESCDGQPLLIYNPETDDDETRRSTYKPVHVAADLAAKLRPHQREGVAFMFSCLAGLKKGGFQGAILMDGMGLGKTFQSICTLWTILTTGVDGQPTCSRPLILCPSSLVMNWGNELKRWLGADRVDPVALDDTRGPIVKEALSKVWSTGARGLRGIDAVKAGGAAQRPQVLVMSYTTFRKHKETLYKMHVDVVICDEAHCLKNGDAQLTQAVSGLTGARRLLLSGTPVQNDLSEFFTLFNVAVPGLLGEATQFRKTYELPIQRGQDADASERDVAFGIERSQQMLAVCGPYMLRRTCGVMAQYLPPKVEQVIFCRMSTLQVKLYQHFYNSTPVQRLLRGGRAAELRDEKAAAVAAAAAAASGATPSSLSVSAPLQQTMLHGTLVETTATHTTKPSARVLCDITNLGPNKQQRQLSGKAVGKTASRVTSEPQAISKPLTVSQAGRSSSSIVPPISVPDLSAQVFANTTEGVAQAAEPACGGGRVSGKGAGRVSGRGQGAGVPRRHGDELSVLAAITAVKKLCCHPDLIFDMLSPPTSNLHRAGTARALPTRASSGGTAVRDASGCAPANGAANGAASGAVSGAASGAANVGASGAAAAGHRASGCTTDGGGVASVITGFEGSLPLFRDPGLPSTYTPHKCEPIHSGKVLVLVHLLRSIRANEPTDKVVLVSNYTEALDMLGKLCVEQKWPWLRLDGSLSVKQRQPLVDQFNDPTHPSFLFLLSSKAGGVGLNIIGANRLILFDPDWNPANDLQAMARVWREGQKKKVWIYRMLTTGSLEEKVYQRQLMKQGLSKSVVDDSGTQSRQFSTEELRALFKVDPTATCDTHAAIKCKCDGSKTAMEAKQAAAQQKALQQQQQQQQQDADMDQRANTANTTEKEKAPQELGVIDWAHLTDISQSPDAVWQHVPPFVRQRFVTYVFSDHITNQEPHLATHAGAVVDEEAEEDEAADADMEADDE